MTDERALEIELALRRAAMDGPPDDRQRLVGLALEVLTGWRRARDLATAASSTADHWRSQYRECAARLAAVVARADAGPEVIRELAGVPT